MTLKVCVMCTHEKFVEVHQSSANMDFSVRRDEIEREVF